MRGEGKTFPPAGKHGMMLALVDGSMWAVISLISHDVDSCYEGFVLHQPAQLFLYIWQVLTPIGPFGGKLLAMRPPTLCPSWGRWRDHPLWDRNTDGQQGVDEMTDAKKLEIASVVREALLAAFGEISTKSGLALTHLDMKLRLDDGTRLRGRYKPITEGGSGDIEIKVKLPPSATA